MGFTVKIHKSNITSVSHEQTFVLQYKEKRPGVYTENDLIKDTSGLETILLTDDEILILVECYNEGWHAFVKSRDPHDINIGYLDRISTMLRSVGLSSPIMTLKNGCFEKSDI
uniref:uncharacterized protein LOC120348653 n=1 Tax=Styela clava TaxID=7725 RepID=UPI001939EFDF|nr:uncharacterized protein LOC120348653 [Styela clava]